MNIPMNVDVYCSDGLAGHSSQVIVKPTNKQVTHLVVKAKHFPPTEYLAPIGQIMDSTPDMLKLRCTLAALALMAPFVHVETILNNVKSMGYPTEKYGLRGNLALGYGPFQHNPGERFRVTVETNAIPEGEVTLSHDAQVHASVGPIGRLGGFLADSITGQITHLVLREGHLWGQKEVTIPVAQIDHWAENAIYLTLDKVRIDTPSRLYPYAPKRRVCLCLNVF